MKKALVAFFAAICGMLARADTPSQLYAAIGSPAGVTVLSSSTWTTGSDTSLGLGSRYAVSSNGGQHQSSSSLNIQVSGAGFISFSYYISSEATHDKMEVSIDGTVVQTSSGSSSSGSISPATISWI